MILHQSCVPDAESIRLCMCVGVYLEKRCVTSTHIYNIMYSLKPRAIIHISEQLAMECRLISSSLYTATINLYVCVCVGGGSTRDLRSCWLVWLWIAIWLWACYHCFLYKQLIKTHYIKITTRMQAIVGWAWWSHYKHMTCTIIIITCVSHCTISGYTQSILLYAQHGNWDSGWSRPVIHGVCTCCTLCALQDMSRWHGQRWEHSHHLLSSIATAIEEACPWVTSVLL